MSVQSAVSGEGTFFWLNKSLQKTFMPDLNFVKLSAPWRNHFSELNTVMPNFYAMFIETGLLNVICSRNWCMILASSKLNVSYLHSIGSKPLDVSALHRPINSFSLSLNRIESFAKLSSFAKPKLCEYHLDARCVFLPEVINHNALQIAPF